MPPWPSPLSLMLASSGLNAKPSELFTTKLVVVPAGLSAVYKVPPIVFALPPRYFPIKQICLTASLSSIKNWASEWSLSAHLPMAAKVAPFTPHGPNCSRALLLMRAILITVRFFIHLFPSFEVPTCPPQDQPCEPPTFVPTPTCWSNNTCAANSQQKWTTYKFKNVVTYGSVQEMQQAIMTEGPIEACFSVLL